MLPSIMVVTLKFLIWSEKSLQVQLDYSVIINHIQMHENKCCLHICDHLKGGKRGRSARLGEKCICITSSLNKWAEDEQGRLSFFIQITFRSEHLYSFWYSLQAKSLIWQVMFILEMNLCKQIQASVIPYACWWPECKYSSMLPQRWA